MRRLLLILFMVYLGSGQSFGSEQRAGDCFDKFLKKSGLKRPVFSSPDMFEDVYSEEFYLGSMAEAGSMFEKYFEEPVSLESLISEVRHGVVHRQPAVGEFLCSALDKDLIPQADAEAQNLMLRTLHNMVILNGLVNKMATDHSFILRLKDHYVKTREEFLPAESSWWTIYRATGGVFEMAKFLTMDRVLDQYYGFLTKNGNLDAQDLADKNFGLRLNILEATLTDQVRFNLSNAAAGVALMKNPMLDLSEEKGVLKQTFKEGWASLYETWNLAFVLGNLVNMNIILPKLLIPAVIDAEEEDYLMFRGLSLWITIHLYLLHHLNGKEDIEIPDHIRNPLVREWGRINKKYAKTLGMSPGNFVLPWVLTVAGQAAIRKLP